MDKKFHNELQLFIAIIRMNVQKIKLKSIYISKILDTFSIACS
jgi:hypothetical protein